MARSSSSSRSGSAGASSSARVLSAGSSPPSEWRILSTLTLGLSLVSPLSIVLLTILLSSLALYLHRFLESSLAPAFARRYLGTSAWSQIIVGGSNFGELLGAATVFLLSDYVPTPLPWLRLDALALNIVWVLPAFIKAGYPRTVGTAWAVAGCFIPISFGWAAGELCDRAHHLLSKLTSNPQFR